MKKRQIRPLQRFGYVDLIAYAFVTSHEVEVDEPKNYFKTIQSPYKLEWQKSIDEEIASLHKNNTWELVKKPNSRKTMGCKWISKVKEGLITAEPKRFQARLVAKGCTQRMEWISRKSSHRWSDMFQ